MKLSSVQMKASVTSAEHSSRVGTSVQFRMGLDVMCRVLSSGSVTFFSAMQTVESGVLML